MFLNRSQRPPVEHLEWRIRIFGVGAILAVVGIWSNQAWLVNLAIGVLAVGLVLRLLNCGDPPEGEDDREGSAT